MLPLPSSLVPAGLCTMLPCIYISTHVLSCIAGCSYALANEKQPGRLNTGKAETWNQGSSCSCSHIKFGAPAQDTGLADPPCIRIMLQ